jgi:broad specificity phosphatase PhoE
MVTTLYLIRHGETEGSGEKRYKGSIDVPLSETGEAQMQKASIFIMQSLQNYSNAKYLSYLKEIHMPSSLTEKESPSLDAVYCSDLQRAVKSAEIIAGPHGLIPIIRANLRERNFGEWERLSFTEIRDKYPDEFESWAVNPLKFNPPGGESTIEVRDRVIKALDEILNIAAAQKRSSATALPLYCSNIAPNIAIVAHGGVNRIILCHIMGIPLENIFRIEQDYAAVNIIEFWEKYPVVKLINGGVG